jgi:hypothetical protein
MNKGRVSFAKDWEKKKKEQESSLRAYLLVIRAPAA